MAGQLVFFNYPKTTWRPPMWFRNFRSSLVVVQPWLSAWFTWMLYQVYEKKAFRLIFGEKIWDYWKYCSQFFHNNLLINVAYLQPAFSFSRWTSKVINNVYRLFNFYRQRLLLWSLWKRTSTRNSNSIVKLFWQFSNLVTHSLFYHNSLAFIIVHMHCEYSVVWISFVIRSKMTMRSN